MDNMLVDITNIDCCAMGFRREDIFEHCKRVSDLAVLLCRILGVDKRTLYTTAFSAAVHDIGKEYIDQHILNKSDKLTLMEYEYIKTHVDYGMSFLIQKGLNTKIARNVLYHHENFDGTGYKGLKNDEIPLGARIIRICDYWDAIASERPHRRKYSRDEAILLLIKDKRFFDPMVFNAMLDLINIDFR